MDMTMQKKVMTKKRSSDFWSGKVHPPPRENPGYAYGGYCSLTKSYFLISFLYFSVGRMPFSAVRCVVYTECIGLPPVN